MHQYLINLSTKNLKIFFFIITFGLCSNLWAQTLFNALKKSTDLSKDSYPALIKKYSNKDFDLGNIKQINQVGINPLYLNTLLFFNKNNVLNLGIKDRCSLVDLISTELLYTPLGKLQYVIIDFKNKKGKIETHSLKKKKYLEFIGYKQCPASKKLLQHFSPRNLRTTLKNEHLKIPSSRKECFRLKSKLLKGVKSPYLCNIVKKIRDLPKKEILLRNLSRSNYRKYSLLEKEVSTAKSYKKILNKNVTDYLNTFCTYAERRDQFCRNIFKVNYWTHARNGAKDDSALKYYCRLHLGKAKLKKKDLEKCSVQFAHNPQTCKKLGLLGNSLVPKPNCDKLSVALSNSRIYQSYDDCPSKISNEFVVTSSRVLRHINQKNTIKRGSCESHSTYPLAKFDQDFLENTLWRVSLCYDDKIKRKEVCYPTILEDIKDDSLSLTSNMGKILARLRGYKNKSQECKIIQESEHKPNQLIYKVGCYILKSDKNCFGTHCPIKVIYDDLPFNKFKLKSDLNFDLFPFRQTQEARSFIKRIERYKKKKIKKINNVSSFNSIFNKHPKAIFMGLGCAENLLPSFFKYTHINQCSITSFIVDGIIEDSGHYSMITRISFDQIHAPRIIPWNYIFSSIRSYQKLHPLNEWGFYAIY